MNTNNQVEKYFNTDENVPITVTKYRRNHGNRYNILFKYI